MTATWGTLICILSTNDDLQVIRTSFSPYLKGFDLLSAAEDVLGLCPDSIKNEKGLLLGTRCVKTLTYFRHFCGAEVFMLV